MYKRQPYNRGTILKMLLDNGVQEIGDPTQCHAVAIDARAPKFDGGIITRHDSVVFGIVVNKHAERFYDEGEDIWPKRYAIWGRLVAAQPDQIAYIIFDASSRNSFMPTLFPPIEAESIAGLAGKLQLDPSRPMGLRRRQPFGAAVVQDGVIEGAGPHRRIEIGNRDFQRGRIEFQLGGEASDAICFDRRKQRRHEAVA